MRITTTPASKNRAKKDIAVLCFSDAPTPGKSRLFGLNIAEAHTRARKNRFEGKIGQTTLIVDGTTGSRILFVGLGERKSATLTSLRHGAAAAVRAAASAGMTQLALSAPRIDAPQQQGQAIAEGALLGAFRDTRFQTAKKDPVVSTVDVVTDAASEARPMERGIRNGRIFADATLLTRQLVNHPPSSMDPAALARAAKALPGVSKRIMGMKEIKRLGMGALLGVNRGSAKPPVFLHLRYRPAGTPRRVIGICGKGITFDSGGLSLKPAKGMETMKMDMAGAATMIGIFGALGELKPRVEVHGFAPITENMPGGDALKPGDVITALSGKTIEVLNTDAEGRLILADALAYASRQRLDELIDMATLTGACTVALGNEITALLSNDTDLTSRLKTAAETAGEKVWELPLEMDYDKLIKSRVADIKNIGQSGIAGTIIGGLFLKHFVRDGLPWAHLDIAGTAWTDEGSILSGPGGTGAMVRTLLTHILSFDPNAGPAA